MADLVGVMIDGRYEIRDLLARGGMATVYTALDTRLDRLVAVKIMHSHLARDEEFVSRFIREAKAAASLAHPNVIAVHDQGWHQGGPPAVFMVMEFVEGPTLRDVIRERGRLSVDEALTILESILAGVGAAHRAGIVHRDIKPENVILADDGRIKVADFGLARALSGDSTLTADASLVIGTIAYLSPEQVERGIADARSDVYATGILLFEMLTGRKPFEGDSPIQVAYKHVHDDVPAPSKYVEAVPPAVDSLVRRATARNADLRPRDANLFLREVQAVHHVPAIPPTAVKKVEEVNSRAVDVESEMARTPPKGSRPAKDSARDFAPKQRKRIVRRRRLRVLLFILAIALGGWLWYITVGPGASVTTPSLLGLSLDEATQEVKKVGLLVEPSSAQFDEQIPKEHIIKSTPAGGSRVDGGSTISVILSKGPERYDVPALKSLSIAEATSALSEVNLKISILAQQYDASIPLGYVISSTPSAGTKVKRESNVSVVVSKGVEQIDINSYIGKSGDQALSELTEAGAKVTSKNAFSSSVPMGNVISQIPDGPAKVAKGAKISLTISKGPALVKMPNVVGKKAIDAERALEDAGFAFQPNVLKAKGPGKVVGQNPKAGAMVQPGTIVTLDIY